MELERGVGCAGEWVYNYMDHCWLKGGACIHGAGGRGVYIWGWREKVGRLWGCTYHCGCQHRLMHVQDMVVKVID